MLKGGSTVLTTWFPFKLGAHMPTVCMGGITSIVPSAVGIDTGSIIYFIYSKNHKKLIITGKLFLIVF